MDKYRPEHWEERSMGQVNYHSSFTTLPGIRAAKALGFKKLGHLYHPPEDLEMGILTKDRYYPYELKFTTSYDWAMLGVRAVIDKKLGDELRNFSFYTHIWVQRKLATPEEITQAWVEVLEADSA